MNFFHLIVAFKKTSICSFVENIVQGFFRNAAMGYQDEIYQRSSAQILSLGFIKWL